MQIQTLTTEYMKSHCYLLIEAGHAILIDVGDADIISDAIKKESLILDFAIVTHEHCDHIYGCSQIRDEYHCKIYASKACAEGMASSRKNFSKYFNAFIELQTKIKSERNIFSFSAYADEIFIQETTINWMKHVLYLRETPGHSPGSICILLDNCLLFTGDTLMKNDFTETHFLGGSKEQLQEKTIPWLKGLSNELLVYPGHGEIFKLGERLSTPIVEVRK